jgi:hypothetical protein
MNFKEAVALAKQAGYSEAVRLQGGKRISYKLV